MTTSLENSCKEKNQNLEHHLVGIQYQFLLLLSHVNDLNKTIFQIKIFQY